jgi:hypothetical protein
LAIQRSHQIGQRCRRGGSSNVLAGSVEVIFAATDTGGRSDTDVHLPDRAAAL